MKDDFVLWVPESNTFTPTTANAQSEHTRYSIQLERLRLTVEKSLVEDKIFNYYYNGLKKIPEIPFTRNMV